MRGSDEIRRLIVLFAEALAFGRVSDELIERVDTAFASIRDLAHTANALLSKKEGDQ